jgi:hypothetical protein
VISFGHEVVHVKVFFGHEVVHVIILVTRLSTLKFFGHEVVHVIIFGHEVDTSSLILVKFHFLVDIGFTRFRYIDDRKSLKIDLTRMNRFDHLK